MERHPTKPGTPGLMPSKTILISWLRSLFPDLPHNIKFEDFGDGVLYCRILNHFCGSPTLQKILWHPKNEYQYANNLRLVQSTLLQQSLVLPFDIVKVSKKKFLQNWQLLNNFYKHFSSEETFYSLNDDNSFSGNQTPSNIRQNNSVTKRNTNFSKSIELQHKQKPVERHQPFQNPHFSAQSHSLNLNNLVQSSLLMSQYLKQNIHAYNSSPSKGKWSVGAQMLQNNQNAIVDRVKQILLKNSHDTEKIRQIKMLLGMPVQEEEIIKIEDDEVGHIVYPQVEDRQEVNLAKQGSLKDSNKASVTKLTKKPFKI